MDYMIGVDIGTTSTKAVLFLEEGQVVSTANKPYPLYSPAPSIAEQDPALIFTAVLEAVKEVMDKSGVSAERILFVSFSSAMHSVIPVDSDGNALMNSMTWADNRSAAQANRLKLDSAGQRLYSRTGTPIHPMSPLTKLMWLREERPELFARAAKFISIKEYVWAKLFGRYIIDYSLASGTGLFNLFTLAWEEEALQYAGITPERLSELVPTTYQLTGLNTDYAAAMGLAPTTTFIVGASDGVLSNLGVDAIDPGVAAVTIGTSGAIRTVVSAPVTDPLGRYFCYALTEEHWVIGGAVNNGGVILRWAKDELARTEGETAKRLGANPYDLLTEIAEQVRPGADGLLFHPYLSGERAPLWNADARGSFFGLTLHHRKEHMIRAVLEGVIFNLYAVLLAMQESMGAPRLIKATGGFARSQLWRQMMADIFDRNVVVPSSIESSCLGAVVLGLYAIGKADTLSVVSRMVGTTHEHRPNADATAIYRELVPIFIRMSGKLDAEYADIARFQEKLYP